MQVLDAVQIVLFGEGIGRVGGDDDLVAELEGVRRGMPHAHVRVQTRENDGIDAELTKQQVEVGVEEARIPALGNDVIFFAQPELGNDFGPLRARDGVFAPNFELAVDALQVCVVAEDDGDAHAPRPLQELLGLGDDGKPPFALQSARHEIIEHIHDEDRRLVFFHHCTLLKLFCSYILCRARDEVKRQHIKKRAYRPFFYVNELQIEFVAFLQQAPILEPSGELLFDGGVATDEHVDDKADPSKDPKDRDDKASDREPLVTIVPLDRDCAARNADEPEEREERKDREDEAYDAELALLGLGSFFGLRSGTDAGSFLSSCFLGSDGRAVDGDGRKNDGSGPIVVREPSIVTILRQLDRRQAVAKVDGHFESLVLCSAVRAVLFIAVQSPTASGARLGDLRSATRAICLVLIELIPAAGASIHYFALANRADLIMLAEFVSAIATFFCHMCSLLRFQCNDNRILHVF